MTPAGRKGWIRFRFRNRVEAEAAADTLRELEYDVRFGGRDDDGPTVAVDIAGRDLQSALEIAQIHGGEFAGRDDAAADAAARGADGTAVRHAGAAPAESGNEEGPVQRSDPSGGDYDGFEAGVRA
ncbi:MAG: hypothetical protein BLM47_06895 [Candidatus Reconcilbacillus cellulovorans]|uniref:Uncharacterized protein n=1 Tax=Candidatus Reconcilbacillus cellulovorans TaxID=1906605 RepID=A0A2A6E0W5_9BACL|nr:MAG: hypothetical protein BLM47_06895 [Candidatus Reconcilbacillus cellulovorans]